MKTTEKAYAKLNLSLDVLAKREDGYHDMRMLMQSVALCDEISLSLREDGGYSVSTNLHYLPGDERNIAVKAAKAFFARLDGAVHGADIVIQKRIPVCAGMGGGSSDGAAVLRALNRLFDKPFSLEELREIGLTLGADIPFCVSGGTALAEGKGELLTALSPLPDCHIVIAKPRFSVSTPALFARLDLTPIKYRPDTQGLLQSLQQGTLEGVCRRMYNVFEDAIPKRPNDIARIKARLLDFGALGAVMTGTGSAVFGIFGERAPAEQAFSFLSGRYADVFLTNPQPEIAL